MTSFAVDTQGEFFENIYSAEFGLWHTGMTTHALNVDFPIESGIEFFVTRREVPKAFLGVIGERGLVKVVAVHPKMTVGMLATSDDMCDFFSAIVGRISALKSEFLDIHRPILPIGEVE